MRRTLLSLSLLALLGGGLAAPAVGAQELPTGCTKHHGTVTCTTTDSPGKNQGGVGSTTTDQTQGNTTNKSPEESQELATDECAQRPEKSQGGFAC